MQNIDCLETDWSTEGGHVGCEGDWRGATARLAINPWLVLSSQIQSHWPSDSPSATSDHLWMVTCCLLAIGNTHAHARIMLGGYGGADGGTTRVASLARPTSRGLRTTGGN